MNDNGTNILPWHGTVGPYPTGTITHVCRCGTVTENSSKKRKRCDPCNAVEWERRRKGRMAKKRAVR